MFWKMYFVIYAVFVALGNYAIYKNIVNFHMTVDFVETGITLFSIVPLFLFSFKIKNKFVLFWQTYYVLFLFIECSYLYKYFYFDNVKVAEGLVGILLSAPAYVGIYLFVFPRKVFKNEIASKPITLLVVFDTRQEAEVLRRLLETSSIPVIIQADDCGGIDPRMNLYQDVKIYVDSLRIEDAKDVLRAFKNQKQ